MAEETVFENEKISNFEGLVTLTLTLDRVIPVTCNTLQESLDVNNETTVYSLLTCERWWTASSDESNGTSGNVNSGSDVFSRFHTSDEWSNLQTVQL